MLLRNTEHMNSIDTRLLFDYEDLTKFNAKSGVSSHELVSDILSSQVLETYHDYMAHVEIQSTKMTLKYVERLERLSKDTLGYV